MEFEFMTGAMFFALVNLLIALMVGYMFFVTVESLVRKDRKVPKWTQVGLIVVGIFGLFFNSVAQPKQSIQTPPNHALEQYHQTKDYEWVVPEERTENLEGFTPLKQE